MRELSPGQMFGAWEVVKPAGFGQKYLCICRSCGETEKNVRASDLVAGKTLMCKKCSQGSLSGSTTDPRTSFEYNTWVSMNQRCYNPKCKDYKNYGARGITIFEPWKESFEAFYLMVGPRPDPSYTLERIDYNRGYEPGNVKWIPRAEQPLNKRDNVRLEIDGETKIVSEWALDSRCSVSMFTIYKRLKNSWEPKEAVFAPNGSRKGTYK
jgi:hypothetical protein